MDLLLEGALEDQRATDKETYDAYVEKVLDDPEEIATPWLELEDSTYR